jgi:hypothetical protein
MPDWQERITRETRPELRAEHALRYGLAAPIVTASPTWCDLGCGNGVAAADAVGGAFTGRAILVDVEQQAAEAAARELGSDDVEALVADLNDPADVARVREGIVARPGPRAVTCFEVVEHLRNFVPLVEMLTGLAEDEDTTVLLSVPNDAFWALDNPYHETMWGEGAFDELRGMLPDGAVVVRQVALQGSAALPEADEQASTPVDVALHAAGAVPTHFVAAIGPRAGEVSVRAAVTQTDLDARRRWEREREADLAYFEELVRTWRPWFEEWRTYIHDLESRLGLPPSGVSPEELPAGGTTGPS